MKNIRLIKSLVVVLSIFICLGQNVTYAQGEQDVLVVDAGVLPNSKFYFLDKFDEWMQENVFTFGVSSLRAEAVLANASERVSEAQILNAQGLLSDRLADKILSGWRKGLFFSADILGSQMKNGKTSDYLIQQSLGIMFSGKEALDEEMRDDILLTSKDQVRLEYYLWETEEKTLALISGDDEINFKPALNVLTKAQIFFAEKNIAERKRKLAVNNDKGKIQFAGIEMIAAAEDGVEQAKKFTENNDYKNALDEMYSIRNAIHLSGAGTLLFDEADDSDNTGILEKIYKAEETVTNSGLLDIELVNNAKKDLVDRLGVMLSVR